MTKDAERLGWRTLRQLRGQLRSFAPHFDCELITYDLTPVHADAWSEEEVHHIRLLLQLGLPQVWADTVETEGFDDLATLPGPTEGWKLLLSYGPMPQAKAALEALCGTLVRAVAAIPRLVRVLELRLDDPSLDPRVSPVEGWIDVLKALAGSEKHPGVWDQDADLAVETEGGRPLLYCEGHAPLPLDHLPADFVDHLRCSLEHADTRVYRVPGVLLATANAVDWMCTDGL